MPPRTETELDQITLHNLAMMNMDEEPSAGFGKLQFLIQQNNFPDETFANLCILYVKYSFYSFVADVLAENAHLTYKYLTPFEYEFLEAKIIEQTSPAAAFTRFEEMASKQIENLRKLAKDVLNVRKNNNENSEMVKKIVQEFDDNLEQHIPIIMAQCNIYWELKNYDAIEKIFRKSVEFCSDHDIWRLNVGHVLFVQDNKYKDAIGFYEPIVRKHYDNVSFNCFQ
jgi:tetratricopeptide repeat protein 30